MHFLSYESVFTANYNQNHHNLAAARASFGVTADFYLRLQNSQECEQFLFINYIKLKLP